MPKFCILIPVYNHAELLQNNIAQILSFGIPIILINDGNNHENSVILNDIARTNSGVTLCNSEKNCGKGASLKKGFYLAYKMGFSHALQIDADGQHKISDIPIFIKTSEENEQALINGVPFYDKKAPKSRIYGRKLTNFWVAIETRSLAIRDAMCGFRIYPLKSTIKVLESHKTNQRMGFDIEILVLLHWAKVRIINLETNVVYPPNGKSNFQMFRDNLQISFLHAKLFLGMIRRVFLK